MKNPIRLCKVSALANVAALALLFHVAPGFAASDFTVSDVWARATVPGQRVGAAYMNIETNTPLVLVKIETPIAEAVQIHTMLMEDGIMKMRERKSLNLSKGEKVELAPGGTHLMLLGLKQRLIEGGTVPLTLTVVNAAGKRQTMQINAPVKQARIQ